MQLTQLTVENLRSISRIALDLSVSEGVPRRRVVFLGANGAGKTTLLDAIAHAFQSLGSDLGELGARGLETSDVRNLETSSLEKEAPARRGSVEAHAVLAEEERRAISDYRPDAPKVGTLRFIIGGEIYDEIISLSLPDFSAGVTNPFEDAARAALLYERPPCVFLPADRGVLEQNDELTLKEVSEFDPRRDCLSRGRSRFNALAARLSLAFAGDTRLDPSGRVKRMWKVLQTYFPDMPQPAGIDGFTLRFRNREGAQVPLAALSDGERAILLIFGEIALRTPSQGIILIDEVEQHLHPRWQRTIAEALAALAPKAQFFITTQSPYFATSVPDDVIEVGDWKRHGE